MHLRGSRWFVALWLVMVGSSEPGCSHSSGGSGGDLSGGETHEDEEVLMEACEHMAEGPSRQVQAAPWGDASPPSVATPHTRYDVALGNVEGGQGGDLSFAVSEAGTLWIALSEAVSLQVLRRTDGQVVDALEEVNGEGLPCQEVHRAVAFPVTVGTLVLRIGPTSRDQVSLVLELLGGESAHDHHEE